MSKLFLVKIGRKTRSGNMQELITHSVSVPDEASIQDLYRYFCPRYKGFDVIIEQPECEELPDMPIEVRPPNPESGKRRGSLSFMVKHNDFEDKLFKEYREHTSKADEKLRYLHDSIRERYKKLPYANIRYWYDMELTTDSSGTHCGKLLIKSNDFFKVIKDCDDGTAALEIIENTESSNSIEDSDLPY